VAVVASEFTLYPAIDLRRGRCVRLERGAADRETVYETDPAAVIRRFAESGASWVHVVDLDAAFGEGSNRSLIGTLVGEGSINVQTGGGLRTLEDLQEVLEAGASRAVIGTAAVERPELVAEAVKRWGPERIAIGIDARGHRPAVRGWREETGADLFTLAQQLVGLGIRTLIYTDIDRDGMLGGPNIPMAAELARRTGADVIVSGGVANIGDVVAAAGERASGIAGVILGKALYEGRIQLTDALRAVRSPT
jgi:phosphoribosylformimino-5-aminoimidazole carboxamide ribotide isomerase